MRIFKKVLSLLVAAFMCLTIMPLAPRVAAASGGTAYLGHDIKAYQMDSRIKEYPEQGTFVMGGEDFSYGIVASANFSPGVAYYRIDGKYALLTGLYGPVDGNTNNNCTTQISDENDIVLATLQSKAGDLPTPFSVDVTGVQRIKIIMTHGTHALANAVLTTGQTPTPTTYSITASASPINGGSVSGGGTYQSDSNVTLLASAYDGWAFNGWYENGSIVSANATWSFSATANRSLEAMFVQNQPQQEDTDYIIVITGGFEGEGAVTVTPGGNEFHQHNDLTYHLFEKGTVLTLSTTPSDGWVFDGWYENTTLSGGLVKVSDSPVWSVTVDYAVRRQRDGYEARQFMASFKRNITVTASPAEGGTVSGGGSYGDNSGVTLKAVPNSGWTFTGWYENGSLVSSDASWFFRVAGSRNLEARFAQSQPKVEHITVVTHAWPEGTVLVTPGGDGVYQSGVQTYRLIAKNTVLTLSATPNGGLVFDGWYENTDLVGNWVKVSDSPVWSVAIDYGIRRESAGDESRHFEARYKYAVTVTASPAEGGTVTGGGSYDYGAAAILSAAPNSGWTFAGWYENGSPVSSDASWILTVLESRDPEARFARTPTEGTAPNLDQASEWAHESLNAAFNAGLIPAALQSAYMNAITRAEFCALAAVLYETVTGTVIAERKSFVDSSDINVQKMGALDVVYGVGGDRFDPNGTLTREQAAAILSRLATVIGKPLSDQVCTFADKANISSWAAAQVGQMQKSGVMVGVGGDRFDPQSSYTREQSIITILRLYNIVS